MASCSQVESSIQAYLDDELAAPELALLEEHIGACSRCAAQLGRQKSMADLLTESLSEHRLVRDLAPAVMAHLPEMDQAALMAREITIRSKQPQGLWLRYARLIPVFAPLLLAVLGLTIFMMWPAAPERTLAVVGTVTYVEGDVLRSADASTERSRTPIESAIAEETRFETLSSSRAQLTLAGPTHIKVAPSTRLEVHDARHISVASGAVWLSVSKDASRYFRVETPSGDVTVFGTVFGVEVLNGRTVVTVHEGTVQVENDVAFTVIEGGTQVACSIGEKPLVPRPADAAAALAWEDMIQPVSRALEHFAQTVPPAPAAPIRAEQVFVVQTHDSPVEFLELSWRAGELPSEATGLDVYVYDAEMRPLFREHIGAGVFERPESSSYHIAVPGGLNLQPSPVLHIKAIPDVDGAGKTATFVEVNAIPPKAIAQ